MNHARFDERSLKKKHYRSHSTVTVVCVISGSPTYNVTEMTPATPWVGNTSPPVPASAFRKMDSTPPLSSTEEIATTLFCPGTQYQQLEPNPTGTSQYHQNAAPKNGASQRRGKILLYLLIIFTICLVIP